MISGTTDLQGPGSITVRLKVKLKGKDHSTESPDVPVAVHLSGRRRVGTLLRCGEDERLGPLPVGSALGWDLRREQIMRDHLPEGTIQIKY